MKNDNPKLKTNNVRGKQYQSKNILIEKNKLYSLEEALELLKEISYTKFDATVEVHIKTAPKKKTSIRSTVNLTEYKADAAGNIHQIIGKLSWDKKKLTENYLAFLAVIKQYNPTSVTLCTTMSPGLRLQI